MNTIVITAPAAIVTWTEAKAHLRLDGDDEKTYVEALVAAATAWIDGPAGWLGRAIGEQDLESRFPCFHDQMNLMAPVVAITSVGYADDDGQSQTMPATEYRVIGTPSQPQMSPAYGFHWPSARSEPDAVHVRYRAGYAVVPAPIKQAILLLVGQWYATREAVNIGNIVNEMPFAVEALLSVFRVWR